MNLAINFICMYSGYKVVSCKNELIPLLEKLGALGYRWGSGEPLDSGSEFRSLINSYRIGDLALVFKRDTKRVYYCNKSYIQHLNFEGQ